MTINRITQKLINNKNIIWGIIPITNNFDVILFDLPPPSSWKTDVAGSISVTSQPQHFLHATSWRKYWLLHCQESVITQTNRGINTCKSRRHSLATTWEMEFKKIPTTFNKTSHHISINDIFRIINIYSYCINYVYYIIKRYCFTDDVLNALFQTLREIRLKVLGI